MKFYEKIMDDRFMSYDFPIVLSFWWYEYPKLDFLFYQNTILGCVDTTYAKMWSLYVILIQSIIVSSYISWERLRFVSQAEEILQTSLKIILSLNYRAS